MRTYRPIALLALLVAALAGPTLVDAGSAAAAPVAAPPPPADGGGWGAFPVHQAWTDSATPRVSHLDEGSDLPFGLLPQNRSADGRAHDRVAYVQFDATTYAGATLTGVTLEASLSAAGSCPAAPAELWASDPVGAAPTAGDPPTLRAHLGTLTWQVPGGSMRCQVALDVTASFAAARAAGESTVTFAFVRPADLALARHSGGTLSPDTDVRGAYQYPVAKPTGLHPSGSGPNERYQRSPVTFRAAPGNPGNRPSTIGFQIQRLGADGSWLPVASPTTSGSTTQPLPDGDVRWRARTLLAAVVGPWSRWTTITVDSRTPAAPVVTIPDGPFVAGRPVDVTISSPDGVAALYYLSEFSDPAAYGVDQDPCTIGHGFVCPATLGGSVTVPYAFLQSFDQLFVTAYGRGGTVSTSSPRIDVSTVPDTEAVNDATRWPLPTTNGPAARVAEVHGGPPLTIGPSVAATTQQVDEFDNTGGGDAAGPHRAAADTVVDVASIDTAVSTVVHTTAPVIDTASTFSIGVVVSSPTDTGHDVTVFDQPGRGGTAFSLVLLTSGYWRACFGTVDGQQSCTGVPAFRGGDYADVVSVSYDAVDGSFAVSTADSPSQAQSLPGSGSLRPAVGGLRFAAATVPGTVAYAGPLGDPLVAHGWVTGADVAASLAGT